eukprot:CAMPEP_0185255600 /NCGR_PEP_ID=MMETSP1359-20130426/4675_1 /TAXON_ID=552665 /ORGANISM="Bigelowiella longifila, Strain CCMP242" /LENGTH=281 /DNA_ID=CAMNT_0027839657 /DNA_START=52 /DNA_END=897 /DNA_ORIENTATION=+
MHVDSKPAFLRLGAGRKTRGRNGMHSTRFFFDRLVRKLPGREYSRQHLMEGRLNHWGHQEHIRCAGSHRVLLTEGGEEHPSEECEAENPILQLQEAVNRVANECPWALDQTPESIIKYLVSEVDEVQEHLDISQFTPERSSSSKNPPQQKTSEPDISRSLVDAHDRNGETTWPEFISGKRKEDDNKLEDELGDLLMNVLLLTSIAKSQASRDVSIQGAAKRAVEKLHRRCPYIFGAERVDTIEEARAVWQRVKREERQREEEGEEDEMVKREKAGNAKAFE